MDIAGLMVKVAAGCWLGKAQLAHDCQGVQVCLYTQSSRQLVNLLGFHAREQSHAALKGYS